MALLSKLSNIVRSEGDPEIIRSGPSSLTATDRLGRGLGWFSIALGLVQVVAPRRITRALGLRGREGLVRAIGAREIASGVVSLSVDRRAGLASRVAGDALDIVALAQAMHPRNPRRDNVALAMVMLLGVTLLDVVAASGSAVRHGRWRGQAKDYSDRSGFPRGVAAARGAAARGVPAPERERAG